MSQKESRAEPRVTKDFYSEAVGLMAKARELHSSVLVSFSGGKDSFVVLDMCAKAGFTKIVLFHRCLIPGIKIEQKYLDYAVDRYKVELVQFPEPGIIDWLKAGNYNDVSQAILSLHTWKGESLRNLARQDTGISLFCTGSKKSDAMGQGLANLQWANKTVNDLQPIIGWNKFHVLSYLKANKIPLPENDGRNSSSMDLAVENILWLYENHRDDYNTFKKVFPYIEAAVYRKKWYGIPK